MVSPNGMRTVTLRASVTFEEGLKELREKLKNKGINLYGTQISERIGNEMKKGSFDSLFITEAPTLKKRRRK